MFVTGGTGNGGGAGEDFGDRIRQPVDTIRANTSNKATECDNRMTGSVPTINRGEGMGSEKDKISQVIIPKKFNRFEEPKSESAKIFLLTFRL